MILRKGKKMNRFFSVILLVVSILIMGFSFPSRTVEAVTEEASVPEDGCYIGVFREGSPANMEFIKAFERTFDKKPAMVMWYLDYSYDFPTASCAKVDAYGAVPHIVWEPWIWGNEESINLDVILGGGYDVYMKNWAKDAKKYGKTVFVRWGHEFNIKKYPWGVPSNDSDPQKYIKAVRHVGDIFKKEKADNVKWIWCFNNYPEPDAVWNEYEKAYPGDDYVDWIGIDGYNWGTTQSWSGWETFAVLFKNQVRSTSRSHPGKPIMIAEFGSTEDDKDPNAKARWIKEIPDALKISMKQVKAIVLFDVMKECDWRSNSCKATETAYKQMLSDPFFLSDAKSIANLKVKTASNEKKKAKAKKAVKPLKLDGDLGEWSDSSPIVLSGREMLKEGSVWFGDKDVSGKVYIKWDNEYLYVAADVDDNMPFSNSRKDADIWNGDAIEVVIGLDNEAPKERDYMSNQDYQIGFGSGDGGMNKPSIWIWKKRRSPKGGEITAMRKVDPQGYILEAKVPWAELGGFSPKAGIKLGFDVAIDDADVKFERKAQLVWSGDYLFYKDPSVWGEIELIN